MSPPNSGNEHSETPNDRQTPQDTITQQNLIDKLQSQLLNQESARDEQKLQPNLVVPMLDLGPNQNKTQIEISSTNTVSKNYIFCAFDSKVRILILKTLIPETSELWTF